MDEPQPGERSQDYEERKRALLAKAEQELDEYSKRGIVSPGALKAARWISRGLWLAMAALMVFLLWKVEDSVPRKQYEEAIKERDKQQSRAQKGDERLEAISGALLMEAARRKLLGTTSAPSGDVEAMLADVLASVRAEGAGLRQATLDLVELARDDAKLRLKLAPATAPTAQTAEETWKAAEGAKGIERLALVAAAIELSGPELREKVATLATSSRPAVERILALRWKKGGQDATWRKVLEALAEGDDLVAEEAEAALK